MSHRKPNNKRTYTLVGVFLETIINFLPNNFSRSLTFYLKVCLNMPSDLKRYRLEMYSRKETGSFNFKIDVFGHLKW